MAGLHPLPVPLEPGRGRRAGRDAPPAGDKAPSASVRLGPGRSCSVLLARGGASPHPRHLTGDIPVRLVPTLALSTSAAPAGSRIPAAVRAARRPAIVRAPPLLNIHAERAARPAPSPAGLGLGVRFRSFFLPEKERGSCFLSPQYIFGVPFLLLPRRRRPLPPRLPPRLRPRLPGYLCLAASRSLAQLSAAPRPHAPGPSSRRAARGAGAGA